MGLFISGFIFLFICFPVGVAMIIGAIWLKFEEGEDDEK